ncbi:DNA-processing protein DprA [Oceanobacillus sp. CAU 1775]
MKAIRYRLIHVHRARGIGRNTIRKFLKFDPTLESIYKMSPKKLSLQFSIPQNKAVLFYQSLHNEELKQKVIQDIKRYKIITLFDEIYPNSLRTINDAPLVIYTLGDTTLLNKKPSLSVIGTRNPSNEAKSKMEFIINPLIHENWVIISGMAKGIDGFAHEITLNQGGKTIAVLGGGFEYIYPKENTSIFNRIARQGLILSEYPPDLRPAKYHFPERNRIISGLSFGTLVIEAMERSGTMITVEQALDQGRDVFAVPGSPLIPQTKGCNLLIQDGAKLTKSANDIREDWLQRAEQFE